MHIVCLYVYFVCDIIVCLYISSRCLFCVVCGKLFQSLFMKVWDCVLMHVVSLSLIFYEMCSRCSLHVLWILLFRMCCLPEEWSCICRVLVSGWVWIYESSFSFFCQLYPVCFLVVSVCMFLLVKFETDACDWNSIYVKWSKLNEFRDML